MGGEVVLVAVDATKEITDYALEWAVRNVIRTVDSLILLALLQSHGPRSIGGNPRKNQQSRTHKFLACLLKKWGLHRDVENSDSQVHDGVDEETDKINDVCVKMMRQLCSANNVRQVKTQVQIVANARMGSVAAKAEELGATWVVLDRRLKKEGDCCLKQLNCNIVLIDHAIPKILRSITTRSKEETTMDSLENDPTVDDMLGVLPNHWQPHSNNAAPESNISSDTKSTNKNISSSLSSADKDDSRGIRIARSLEPLLNQNSQLARCEYKFPSMYRPTSPSSKSQPLKMESRFDTDEMLAGADPIDDRIRNYTRGTRGPKDGFSGKLMDKPPKVATLTRRSTDSPKSWQCPVSPVKPKPPRGRRRRSKDGSESESTGSTSSPRIDRTSSIRKAMSLSFKQPPTPPPLCSVCRHNAPIFGKPPRKFSYEEVEIATDGFSRDNFLAEGGYGPVYRGVLADGQVVAVKQQKVVSAQGASEFCAEVEVLSCAQHRNLVMLVGYCMEREWLLVYEFACNGSLDKHLNGKETTEVMAWKSRQKVAVGAARGLRYLHEDCRVGCIVHRDLRPNNILLTHDFEPMVGDFGLARWQADGQLGEETRIIGAFGYLAPEYTQTGQITEKADVYAFGVVLMELLTGQKAVDSSRGHKEQYLPEWGRPLLEKKMVSDIIDPRLDGNYAEIEVERMMYAASSCILPDPERRPRMSKVLRILEGDMPSDMASQVHHFQYTQKNTIPSSEDERNSTNNSYPYHSVRKPVSHKDQNSPLHSDYRSTLSNRLTAEHTTLVRSPRGVVPANDFEGNNCRSRMKPRSVNEIPSVGHEMGASSSWSLNQNEQLGSEEYQNYL